MFYINNLKSNPNFGDTSKDNNWTVNVKVTNYNYSLTEVNGKPLIEIEGFEFLIIEIIEGMKWIVVLNL